MIQVAEHGVGLSVVIFRGCILLVAAFTGGMSIFLGWQLYRDAVFFGTSQRPQASAPSKPTALTDGAEAPGKSEYKTKTWPIRLAGALAGVFLAIFGMMFIAYLAYSQADIVKDLALPK